MHWYIAYTYCPVLIAMMSPKISVSPSPRLLQTKDLVGWWRLALTRQLHRNILGMKPAIRHVATDLHWEVVEAMDAVLFTTADLAEIIDMRFEMTSNASIVELWG